MELTPGRRWALAVGTPLAVLFIAYGSLSAVAYAGQGSYPVRLSLTPPPAPARQLAAVSVPAGNLSLVAGTGTAVRITGTAHYAIFRSRMERGSGAGGLTADGRCLQPTGPCHFDLTVAVPPQLAVSAYNASGDLSASGVSGSISLSSGSGSITLTGVSGDIGAHAQSGDVTASRVSGRALTVSDESGRITLSGISVPKLTVSDASGDITVIFTSVPDLVTISNLSGGVTVVLPRGGTAYDVHATTSSGSSTVTVPTDSRSPHVITVTDQSGDVRVTQ